MMRAATSVRAAGMPVPGSSLRSGRSDSTERVAVAGCTVTPGQADGWTENLGDCPIGDEFRCRRWSEYRAHETRIATDWRPDERCRGPRREGRGAGQALHGAR